MSEYVKPRIGELLFNTPDEAMELMERGWEGRTQQQKDGFAKVMAEAKRLKPRVLAALDGRS